MTSSNYANQNDIEEAVALELGLGVEVIELTQLSVEEERDRLQLERRVERAFYEAGIALKELRDRRLYRSTHKTFEEYCRARFGYGRDAAYLKIGAAEVYENLHQIMPTNCRQIPLPTNEHQLRYIAKAKLELKGKGGCWCIVTEVHEFSCQVNTWDGEYLVRPEYLKSCNYSGRRSNEGYTFGENNLI